MSPRAINNKLRRADGTSLLLPIHLDLDRTPLLPSPTKPRRDLNLYLTSRSLNSTSKLDLNNSILRLRLFVINNNLTNNNLNTNNNNSDRTNLTPNPHT